MERHEIKALVDARMAQGKRSLDAMKAKAASAKGEADERYRESVEQLQKEHDEIKIRAARVWDAADDQLDSAHKDLERTLSDWEELAEKAGHGHSG